ncbi:MAG TPA: ABATE domain-containing protein [Longimicrobiales bacterium]|nr:ABATE domain-containing protein [Longimicrobiales bacterium]
MVTFEMVGGRTCLDFANTASQRRNGPFKEKLETYEDLLAWAVEAEQLTEAEAAGLRRLAAEHPAGAAAVLARGRELREAIYRVFTKRAAGEDLPADDLKLISVEYGRAAVNRLLTPSNVGVCSFEWQTHDALDRPLWPVAVSATNLVASEDALRVKECATDNCNWLFLDASKNRSRRWCEMKECGNRAKARRHYHRKKA